MTWGLWNTNCQFVCSTSSRLLCLQYNIPLYGIIRSVKFYYLSCFSFITKKIYCSWVANWWQSCNSRYVLWIDQCALCCRDLKEAAISVMYLYHRRTNSFLKRTRLSWYTPVKLVFRIMTSRTNYQFLIASVNEFISVWACGGEASLNLTTSSGITTIGFNCTLGFPGAPHSHFPSSSP